MSQPERWERALCADLPVEESDRIFFRGNGRPPLDPPYKKLCGMCTIRNFCLAYAVVHQEAGVWGGLSEAERKRLPSYLRAQYTDDAKRQGWYENRKSIDEILQEAPTDLELKADTFSTVSPDLLIEQIVPESKDSQSIFEFDSVVTASSEFEFRFDFESAS